MPVTNVGGKLSSLGNLVLGGVQRALRFGAGGPAQPNILYLSYRVYDPVTGALVIAHLPHPHRSTWTIRALQPGNVGSSSIGDFSVPCFTPEDDEYRKVAPVLALLQEGQRVEGYVSPGPDLEPAGGLPIVSGVIRTLPTALNSFEIKGVDTLFLLQSSRTQRTEFFSGRTDQLAALALRAYTLTYGDDFTSNGLFDSVYAEPGAGAGIASPAPPTALLGVRGVGAVDQTTPTLFGVSLNYSEHIEGSVTPLYSETYTFYVTTDDGARLWVNGVPLVNSWINQGPTTYSGTVVLRAGVPAPIVLEHYQGGGGERLLLEWQSASQARQTVPATAMTPPANRPGSVSAYTQTGAGVWTTTIDEGLPVTTISGDSSAAPSMLTIGNFAQNTYADCILDDYFRLVFANNTSVQHGVVAATTGAFWVLGYLDARFVSVSKWEVDLVIATIASGVITKQVTKTLVVVEPTNGMRGQLALIGKQGKIAGSTFNADPAGPDYLWRLTLNGVDAGCTWMQASYTPSGGVGLLYNTGVAPTGSPQLWATQLVFMSRLNVMQQGIWNTGARSVLQYLPRTPMLDLLNYASVTESMVYRKTPGVGLGQDIVDWGPPAGAQVAGQTPVGSDSLARFAYRENLIEFSQEGNSDTLATDISMQLAPSGDHAGVLNWHMVPAMKKYGIITDQVQAQYLADFLSGRALAQAIGATKSTPGVSKKFKVLRDPKTAGLYRELDYVVVHHPEFRPPILNQRVQVMERTLTEGVGYETVVGDKFPQESFGAELGRMWQTLDQLAIGSTQVTPSSVGAGLVYDSRFGSPTVLPFYGPYLSVDPTFFYKMRFQIPNNVVLIQKVTLAFSLLPYRTYSSFTLSATGGASANHTHGMGHTHTHSHTTTWLAGASTFPLSATNTGVTGNTSGANINTASNNDSTGSSAGSTGTMSVDHTHTVSGSSALGIAEGSVAQGVHVYVDGVDITASLPGGPFGGGSAADYGEFDITPFLLGGGWHEIKFSSTTLGAIVAQGMAFVITKPTTI